jgi:hypothetical protein
MFSDQIMAAPSHAEKVAIMKRAESDPFFMKIFQMAFSPDLTFSRIPIGNPRGLRPENTGENEGYLKNQLLRGKHIYFLDGQNDGIREAKLHIMWVNLLESCAPPDRELLIAVVQKKMPYPGITYDLYREAFEDSFTADWPVDPTAPRKVFELEVASLSPKVAEDYLKTVAEEHRAIAAAGDLVGEIQDPEVTTNLIGEEVNAKAQPAPAKKASPKKAPAKKKKPERPVA